MARHLSYADTHVVSVHKYIQTQQVLHSEEDTYPQWSPEYEGRVLVM